MAKQESSEKPFVEAYEDMIAHILNQEALWDGSHAPLDAPPKIMKLLKDKRDFGIKKYGDISFQSSFDNAMRVDTMQHAREELIDYMNYTLHDIYKSSVKGELDDVKKHIKRFRIAFDLYSYTE